MNRQWSKDRIRYELSDGLIVEKADLKTFSIYFAVYEIYSTNLWFRKSFEQSVNVLNGCEECFFITKDDVVVGGVLLEPNYMNCLFFIPPFKQYEKVIGMLKELLMEWSDPDKDIILGGAKPEMKRYFQLQGFIEGESRRCMIRPTEEYEIKWSDDVCVASVTKDKTEEILSLFTESYVDQEREQSADHEKSLERYFDEIHHHKEALEASTLIYDKKSHELIGACLISIWEEWPNVYDVAVKPSFQKKGIAKNMIRRASTLLKNQYPVLRLFVTLGNEAEYVYEKLGFLAGVEWTEMFIEKKRT